MVNLSIKIRIKPNKKKEFLRSMLGFKSSKGLIENSRNEKGCLNYNFRKSKANSHEFILESDWDNEEDLEEYFSGKKMAILLGAIDILSEDKEIKFTNKDNYLRTNNN